jgi:hypothetical protein
VHAAQERLGHRERQRRLAAGGAEPDAPAEDLDRALVLSHDCEDVTGPELWPEPSSNPPVDGSDDRSLDVACVVVAAALLVDVPPLPNAATASHAAANSATTPTVTRVRIARRRAEIGGFAGSMDKIVAREPGILLGIRYGGGKASSALRVLSGHRASAHGASKVT